LPGIYRNHSEYSAWCFIFSIPGFHMPREIELAFREQGGGHSDLPEWPFFLLFAAGYFQ